MSEEQRAKNKDNYMVYRHLLIVFFLALVAVFELPGQQKSTTAELLGYTADAKLLIIHADDMGMSHSTNMAVIKAFENNAITSGSVMVPCPWFNEIADYVKNHPALDVGIHFTLNAEWKFFKWDGVLPAGEIPSLIAKDGYFYSAVEPIVFGAKAVEVEKELRAQIDKAIACGIKPTHLDSHMGSMFVNPSLFRTALQVAREYKLPIFFPMNAIKQAAPFLVKEIPPDVIVVDNFMMLPGEAVNGDWNSLYDEMLKNLIPGLNEIVVHLSFDNDEMRAIAAEHEDFGSAWRQKDLDLLLGDDFKNKLNEYNVQLVTWREIQRVMYGSDE